MGPDVIPQRRVHRRVGVTVSILLVMLIASLVIGSVVNHRYVVLSPDRSDEEAATGLMVGAVASIATVAALLYYSPGLRSRPILIVPIGFCALMLGSQLGTGLAANLFEIVDFSARPLIGFDAFLRASRFHQSHSRSAHYHLELTDFRPTLDLYLDDYRWNAGDRENLPVTGKCIPVHFERSGRSLRFVQPEHVHAVPCPDPSRIVAAV